MYLRFNQSVSYAIRTCCFRGTNLVRIE